MSAPRERTRRPRDEAVSVGDYERTNEIGKGSFATVYKGVHRGDNKLVAIKSVNLGKLNKKLRDNLHGEINILKELEHPHIVRLLDCQTSSTHIHLVMEYCELSDLSIFIKNRAGLAKHEATRSTIQKYPLPQYGGLNEVVTRHFLKQLASALHFLRAKNLIHRDIKPQNLLLTASKAYRMSAGEINMLRSIVDNPDIPLCGVPSLPLLKVADFGFARSLPSTSLAETLCGSPLYMAPEILRYERYDAKADLWSVGTVLYEMVAGRPPFKAANHVELLRRIEQSHDVIRFPDGCQVSRPMKELIRALLKRNPVERMSFENFFTNDVVTGPIPDLVGEDRPKSGAETLTKTIPQSKPAKVIRESQAEIAPNLGEQLAEAMASSPAKDNPKQFNTVSEQPVGSMPASTPRSRITPSTSPRHTAAAVTASRRPVMPAPSVTAPNIHHQPRISSTAMERTPSGDKPMPPSPLSQEYTLNGPRLSTKRTPTQAEVAAWDVQEEREYVVINTRSVEVNALADQMAADPRMSEAPKAITRRQTTQGPPGSLTGAMPPVASRAVQIAQGRTDHQRRGSYDRTVVGQSPSSATSVIGKAIAGASLRLFGVSYDAQKHVQNLFGGRGVSPPQFTSPFPVYPIPTGMSGLITQGATTAIPEDEDARAVMMVEDNATRSDVVYGFAEVKYRQLIPLAPSMDHGLGGVAPEVTVEAEDDGLTADATVALSEEALVLYVKALSLLAKAMDSAQLWWIHRSRGEIVTGVSPRGNHAAAGNRINSAVQWIRGRFNEVLEKAEFVRAKLIEAQSLLPEEHPGHPNNHTTTSRIGGASTADGVVISAGVTAEKLMYDRALEMSRSAAINEISNTDLAGCEISYVTAIRMLEAVLENADEVSVSEGAEKQNQGDINGIDVTDRESVQKILTNIRSRLASLRKKMNIIAKYPSSLPQNLTKTFGARSSGFVVAPNTVNMLPK